MPTEEIYITVWVVWSLSREKAIWTYTDTDDIPDEYWDREKYKITKEDLTGTADFSHLGLIK